MQGPVVYVALGANLGEAISTLKLAQSRLREFSRSWFRSSSIYRSVPDRCPPGSPEFHNSVVAFDAVAGETPETLLRKLQQLELESGRRPKQILNEARPLDLDLLIFGQERRLTAWLTLPHPRAHLRPFVLVPMVELDPGLVLPGQQQTVKELVSRLGCQGLAQVTRIEP